MTGKLREAEKLCVVYSETQRKTLRTSSRTISCFPYFTNDSMHECCKLSLLIT